MTVTVGRGDLKRNLILNFMIIPCQSAFRGILERSFLERLDAVATPVILKVTYNNAEGTLVLATTNVDEDKLIKEII